MTYNIALIGSGIFAKEAHLPAIQETPSLALKAVYSRSLKSAKSLSENLSGVDLYSEDSNGKNYEELLKRDDIVGVIIALPILAQPEYIKKALLAGKHVFAEKPIAKDVASAQELLEFYNSKIKGSSKATFTIAENFRYVDSFVYGASQLSSLGRILGFRTRMNALVQKGGKYYETEWRKVPEYQGK
jgi:predicted dehydrogenase